MYLYYNIAYATINTVKENVRNENITGINRVIVLMIYDNSRESE